MLYNLGPIATSTALQMQFYFKQVPRRKTFTATLARSSICSFDSLDFKEVVAPTSAGSNSPTMRSPSAPETLPKGTAVSRSKSKDTLTIYAVDDEPWLTEFYTVLLETKGYKVQAFNDRARALSALKADGTKPDLLIMDYLGHSMTVERFIHSCLSVHPSLRILMASGLSEKEIRMGHQKPDRFIRKPFTAEEFLEEVRAALAAENNGRKPT